MTSPAKVVLAVSGHGWGHGLGMSQWGAYGYAKHGWTYDRILAHYYSGTTLGPAPVSTVRVLLAQAKKATIASSAPWTVTDSAGTKVALDPATMTLRPKLALPKQSWCRRSTFVGAAAARRQRQAVPRQDRASRPTASASRSSTRSALESYLKGVVPSEMPSKWPAEALEAQAVAARSYALANLTKKRDFDLYADTRSQVYGGVAAESPAASDAIAATKGQVVLWHGKVADTLFFSTSGGRTAVGRRRRPAPRCPYLVSVADPYDTTSPVHDWGPVLYDGAKVAKQLKLAAGARRPGGRRRPVRAARPASPRRRPTTRRRR